MDLYIRQRVFAWGDKYDITDDQETPVFRVEGEVFTFGAKLHLYDLKGQELYYVEQELFHFMPRYTVYKGRMAIASVRKNFTLFGHSLTVESGYGNFEIEGSVFGWDFRILYNGAPLLGRYLPPAHGHRKRRSRVSLRAGRRHRQLCTQREPELTHRRDSNESRRCLCLGTAAQAGSIGFSASPAAGLPPAGDPLRPSCSA